MRHDSCSPRPWGDDDRFPALLQSTEDHDMTPRTLAAIVAGTLLTRGAVNVHAQVSAGLNEINLAASVTSSKATGSNALTEFQ